jgi:uncharacterized protein YeaC (DUF1315 family)
MNPRTGQLINKNVKYSLRSDSKDMTPQNIMLSNQKANMNRNNMLVGPEHQTVSQSAKLHKDIYKGQKSQKS